MKPVDSLVLAVRRRLNKNRATRAALWAVIAGGGVLLAIALVYVFQGYEVPRYWYALAAAGTAVGALIGALTHRATVTEAAEYADGFFGIKDAIVSNRRFEADHKEGGYYDLQANQTAEVVRPLDAKRVPFVWPQALGACAVVIVMSCLLTAFKSTDQAILDKWEQERQTQSRLDEVKEELLKAVEELEKATGEEEEKLLDPDQLREMVKQLESTKDMAEALKQLANLERKLDLAAKSMETKRDEQLLKKAGEELEKEEDPQARELAKKLKNEQFKEAAKDLANMKPEDAKLAKDKKLTDKRKEAAKLKAAAKRMAAAARQQKSQQSKNSKENEDQNGKASKDAKLAKAREMEDELAEELEKLEMEADEYDESLEDLEEMENLGKIDPSQLEKCEGDGEKLRLRLDKMGDKLAKLGLKKDAQKKLLALGKCAGQCQGYMQGMCQSPFAGKGGLKPGEGSVDSRRDEKDELKDNGQTTQLKGQKGTGPSLTKIEAADDGSGTSNRKAEAKERAFKKQFESFVQREDVPEDVKDGVKLYFESLHSAEPAGGGEQGK
jgi:tetratricopeptide (TPR) repeat protein